MADNFQSSKVTANELSSATKFNNFVQAVEDAINSLDNSNVAAAAAIAVSKLAPGTDTYLLQTVAGVPTWTAQSSLGVAVQERRTTTVDIASSTSELSLYDGLASAGNGWNISANLLGTDKMLRLTLMGDYLFNNNIADTLTLRVKFGGTTFFADAMGSAVLGARQPWMLHLLVANLGATNSQMISGSGLWSTSDTAAPTTGIGEGTLRSNPPVGVQLGISTLATIDTTSAQKLEVSVQWSASSANNSFRRRYAVLELV